MSSPSQKSESKK